MSNYPENTATWTMEEYEGKDGEVRDRATEMSSYTDWPDQ